MVTEEIKPGAIMAEESWEEVVKLYRVPAPKIPV